MATTAITSKNAVKKIQAGIKSSGNTQTGSPGKKQTTLQELLEEGLKDIYNAEIQLVEALPKMAKASDNEDLQDAFEKHLNETKRHVERLEKIFSRLQIEKNEVETCKAMKGLIEESEKIIQEYEQNPVRDSALIIGAQKIEHYEIASYGSLCELCDVLGYHKIGETLGRTLDEEETTDSNLSDLAEHINDEACEMSDESEEEEEDEK